MKARFVMLTVALTGAAAVRSNAADLVAIRMSGHYFSEPATVRLLVTVEPDHENRTLRIEADGERMYRSTEVNLDGLSEKRLHTVEFKNLPAGAYAVRAEVFSESEMRGMATDELTVLGAGNRER
jgi:hypothetical protein